jgi:hypothetical protein
MLLKKCVIGILFWLLFGFSIIQPIYAHALMPCVVHSRMCFIDYLVLQRVVGEFGHLTPHHIALLVYVERNVGKCLQPTETGIRASHGHTAE